MKVSDSSFEIQNETLREFTGFAEGVERKFHKIKNDGEHLK